MIKSDWMKWVEDMRERNGPQKSVQMPVPDLTNLSAQARRDVYAMAGKEIASSMGSRTLVAMMTDSGLSTQDLSDVSGFDVSFLDDIVSGKLPSGPELWMLVAMADAMGYDLQATFTTR